MLKYIISVNQYLNEGINMPSTVNGIGTNYGIQEFIKNILFDEKIGGSIHLAVGKSFDNCGGKNKSALHWDMIKDLRKDGELYFDDKLIQKNGSFITNDLAGLK